MENKETQSRGEKVKSFVKRHAWSIIGSTLTVGSSLLAICLFGQNQKLKGENSNLKSLYSGSQKTIERQAYVIGKQNQKLYGNNE